MNRLFRLSGTTMVAVVAALGVHVSTQGTGSPLAACEVAALQARAPQGTTITGATVVDAAGRIPRYCRVDGHTATPGNEVNFRLGLPERWNGKYYFKGVGGTGGTIGSLNDGLVRGYASASTDTGHVASDENWGADRAKEIDYGHRGTHVTAVAGKALAGSFYGQPVQRAYFDGCSNGGRQALMEVQRYPTDFDGIIAGDPATGTPMQVGRVLVYQKMLARPENYLTGEKIELLSKATLASCDKADGLEDGLITDPRLCTFKPETLKCSGPDGPNCLNEGQLAVVKQIYEGAKVNGETYAWGFPVGHEGSNSGWRAWISGLEEPTRQEDGTLAYTGKRLPSGYGLADANMRFLALERDDPAFNWRVFKFPADLARMKTMTEILSPLDADLRPYKSRGGKLLLYHGWSDPAISANGTVGYYDKVSAVVGGQAAMDAFAKLYLVPGMHHCSGGPGPNEFDMLTVMENWVEKGQSPGPVVATHRENGAVTRTRPLCPHPQVARYGGSGSIDDAANFRCEAPAAR
ncbi:MAG TPA: tannase/feruloyl esterase family alpha/beta hydrolase [Vicinamibacterales bacterium]|nr:tannase/feruloyl esterase family alpha/beta hydrolase [Vicinamibacterales bacterium]